MMNADSFLISTVILGVFGMTISAIAIMLRKCTTNEPPCTLPPLPCTHHNPNSARFCRMCGIPVEPNSAPALPPRQIPKVGEVVYHNDRPVGVVQSVSQNHVTNGYSRMEVVICGKSSIENSDVMRDYPLFH